MDEIYTIECKVDIIKRKNEKKKKIFFPFRRLFASTFASIRASRRTWCSCHLVFFPYVHESQFEIKSKTLPLKTKTR